MARSHNHIRPGWLALAVTMFVAPLFFGFEMASAIPVSTDVDTAPSPTSTLIATSTKAWPARVADICAPGHTRVCRVTVRAGPASGSARLGLLDEGQSVTVACLAGGEAVTPSRTGVTTLQWAQLTTGGWVSAGYLTGLTDNMAGC